MLHIAGGVYREYCMHPIWREIYGSGGRAASAIMHIGGEATLHTYLESRNASALKDRAALERFFLNPIDVETSASFGYQHPLSTPTIHSPIEKYPPLRLSGDKVIRFGMIEGTAIVDAEYAVFDPQNVASPEIFDENGSQALHLAVVLNQHEAAIMCSRAGASPENLAEEIAGKCKAEVVIIKLGARGALVYEAGHSQLVPAFQTDNVWKIGSGDNFVAHFGYQWMERKLSAVDSAILASKATAYYCASQGFISSKRLSTYSPKEIRPSNRFLNGYKPKVYLAGPFFTLAELWLVEQAKENLQEMGLQVFSPYHDVGHGSADDVVELDLKAIHDCDAVFAIGDGLDSGTIYEVGYARAIGKPVIFYSENESAEDKKMMLGSGCILSNDYVTAIYKTLWTAIEQ